MGILSRLFGTGSDDRARVNEKRQKFHELERQFAGDAEMINTTKALWLTNRGKHYGEHSYVDHAILDFQEAITLKPDLIPAFFGLGVAYKSKGMIREALSILKSAPQEMKFHGQKPSRSDWLLFGEDSDPERTITQEINTLIRELELTSSAVDRERANDKRQKFHELERQFAGDAEMIKNAKALWLTNRGNYYSERGYVEQAVEDFKEAITFKPDHIPAFLGLGDAYKSKGMIHQALSILKSAPRTWTIPGQKRDADPAMVRHLNTAMFQKLDMLIRELERR